MKKMEKKNNELLLKGATGAPGIVMGRASGYLRRRPSISRSFVSEGQIQYQLDEFQRARTKVEQELKQMLEDQQEKSTAELVRMQLAVIRDPELNKQVKQQIIDNHITADAAVESVFDTYLRILKQNKAEERSVDITDIRDRLIQVLHDYEADSFEEHSIVIARELSPREVIECADRNVKGIVMDCGGVNSHAAIIARSMGIPMVLGTKQGSAKIADGDQVIINGELGQVLINPDVETQEQYREKIEQYNAMLRDAEQICTKPNETKDGMSFQLRANIEFAEELEAVRKYQAEGVGLLRTESIYLRKLNFKNSSKQESFYRSILEGTAPHPVVIRLFDAGGDKLLEKENFEQNPFLGWRGIRMLLDEEEVLYQQLKAICKVAGSFKGRVRILVPMISTLQQLKKVRELLKKAQKELTEEGITTDKNIQLGIMVEVPNVALQADLFAEHADFLSVGTNDLTQYLLAVDRGNERISELYDQQHPTVWRLIHEVAEAAKSKNIPVSVCGEMAADPISACCLVGMGITELSMNAAALPAVKKALRAHTAEDMQNLARQVLESSTTEEISQTFSNWKKN